MGETPSSGPAGSQSDQPDMWESSERTENPLAGTRVSRAWIAIICFALILTLLLIFVLQNTRKVNISYFNADFTLPLAVAMLLSAVAGVLLAAIAGTWRIFQLRRKVKKGRRS
jgi:putative membrane protein